MRTGIYYNTKLLLHHQLTDGFRAYYNHKVVLSMMEMTSLTTKMLYVKISAAKTLPDLGLEQSCRVCPASGVVLGLDSSTALEQA